MATVLRNWRDDQRLSITQTGQWRFGLALFSILTCFTAFQTLQIAWGNPSLGEA